MTTLRYKEFQGAVSFEDGLLRIVILHIDDLIVTECDSASRAQAEFENLVEDYLDTCRELGREPCKPFKGSFNVRLAPEMHKQIAISAAEGGKTLNAWVVEAISMRLSAGGREAHLVAFLERYYTRTSSQKSTSWTIEERRNTMQITEDHREAADVYSGKH